MYLFTRTVRLAPGNLDQAMAWSVRITEKVNQLSETPVALWSTVLSPRVGTLAWTTVVEDLKTLETGEGKLMADGGYLDLVNQGATFSSGDTIDDTVIQLVATEIDTTGTPRPYASVVRSVLAPGAMASGIELGVEIAQQVKKTTGCPCSFGVTATGPYGGVVWITGYDSIEQLQRAEEAITADAGFIGLIDQKASKAYAPGTAEQAIYRRIA